MPLLKLPNETLSEIFENVVGVPTVEVRCETSVPDFKTTPPRWIEPWVPELRLVSRKVKNIVTPVIAANTRIWIQRHTKQVRPTGEVLVVRKCSPRFMVGTVRTVAIAEYWVEQSMRPIAPVDVSGLPSLRELLFNGVDPAGMIGCQYLEFTSELHSGRLHRGNIKQTIVDADAFVRRNIMPTYPLNEGVYGNPGVIEVACRILRSIYRLFRNDDTYLTLLKGLCRIALCITRDNIEGLLPSTDLTVTALDHNTGRVPATIVFTSQDGYYARIWSKAVEEQKKSGFLEYLRNLDKNVL